MGTGVPPSIPTGAIVRYCGCECCVCLQSTNSKYEVAGVSSDDPVSLIYKVSDIGKRSVPCGGREGGREG